MNLWAVPFALGFYLGMKFQEDRVVRAALSDDNIERVLEEWS